MVIFLLSCCPLLSLNKKVGLYFYYYCSVHFPIVQYFTFVNQTKMFRSRKSKQATYPLCTSQHAWNIFILGRRWLEAHQSSDGIYDLIPPSEKSITKCVQWRGILFKLSQTSHRAPIKFTQPRSSANVIENTRQATRMYMQTPDHHLHFEIFPMQLKGATVQRYVCNYKLEVLVANNHPHVKQPSIIFSFGIVTELDIMTEIFFPHFQWGRRGCYN